MGSVLVAAFFLGIATSIRVLAPLVGVLVTIYFLVGRTGSPPDSAERNATSYSQSIPLHKKLLWISAYALLTILVMLASWPYLWESPLNNFFNVFLFKSENPTGLQVLFNGETYRAFELPRRYLPTFLALTLTEPVWPLFILGIASSLWNTLKSFRARTAKSPDFASKVGRLWTPATNSHQPSANSQLPITNYQLLITDYWLLITAFVIPFLYVITLQPPMYDGFRHFLFIVPPIFITAGLAFQAIINTIQRLANQKEIENSRHSPIRQIRVKALYTLLILAILTPNLLAIGNLHPFEYTYYNSFVGGTGGAFRAYETDYWLTCYKQAVEQFNPAHPNATLYVHREAYIAATYAAPGLTVREERGNISLIRPGDFILVNSRTDEDRKTFHDAPVVLTIGRDGATFCEIKQIP